MYHKDDLIVGFKLLDCQIIKIEGNEYTLECVHCHKLYKYDYGDGLNGHNGIFRFMLSRN